MRSVRLLLAVAFVAIFFGSLGNSQLLPADDEDKLNEDFQVSYTDNSLESAKTVTIKGQFRYFSVIRSAKEKIQAQLADWCGFAMVINSEEDIKTYWSKEEEAEFVVWMRKSDCVERKKKGMFSTAKDKQEDQNEAGTHSRADDLVWIILTCIFGAISLVLLVAVVILCIISCQKSNSSDNTTEALVSDRRPRREYRQRRSRSQRSRRQEEKSEKAPAQTTAS
ncbi:hypothetical protein L596_016060 [Steinernema carpocapsae]|uniref:Uncharacterized protein n=1 Tax=Steinernema carpocapsae TaxID=34508 RepID=A0A4U5NGW2_STECR|nr:hypothetical protein L596_016060 [Steinernema carpocapsae]